jgi:hypothetical protein
MIGKLKRNETKMGENANALAEPVALVALPGETLGGLLFTVLYYSGYLI